MSSKAALLETLKNETAIREERLNDTKESINSNSISNPLEKANALARSQAEYDVFNNTLVEVTKSEEELESLTIKLNDVVTTNVEQLLKQRTYFLTSEFDDADDAEMKRRGEINGKVNAYVDLRNILYDNSVQLAKESYIARQNIN